jgi:4-hydroxy-3-methylbut-2-enyl diphosphate reductase
MATTSAVAVSAASAFAGSALSNRRVVKPVRASRVVPRASASGSDEKDAPFDARAFRRELSKSPKYNRSFKKDEESADAMETAGIGMVSKGGLVAQMRVENFTHVKDDVTLKLADAYGFCWGVERAVQMAYEARKQYPHEQIHITNEIIHNPTVNKRLEDMGVKFIAETKDGKDFSGVKDGEVVILPAFGASVHEMKLLAEKGVSIVDTTCPWVSKVWNAVDSHKKKEFTSIIHGKWAHEETVATVSFAGVYLVVKDLAEAEYVCDYILNGGDKAAFMKKFDNAHSTGFDPETDLIGLGIANQTTMLKGETEMIGKLLEKTMMAKYGVLELNDHYKNAGDTICDATQERQDAMYKLVEEKPDLMLVIGGFNSSNTQHLQEISEDAGIVSYWVDTPDRVDTSNVIVWRTAHGELITTKDWLPAGDITIGVTSGASTPDKVVEDVIDLIFQTKAAMKAAVAA